jgi:Transglycosylase-like domain
MFKPVRTRVPVAGRQHDGAFVDDHLHTDDLPRARRRFSKRNLALLAAGTVVVVGAGCAPIGVGSNLSGHPFLTCTRQIESNGNYAAVNPSGKYRGAYQFSRSTWDATARHAGRPDLVGVDPAAASPGDQDFLALHLYQWQGASPWNGRCAGR